ncbi:hypothetical protein [Tengunoibacter tsumagoiensis]|uniref:Uncharacterized protein n=1 Tax=Tengunoibacter tsumagoiensis TaxID=2014871 RepID=A0A402A250_9CHLR|nr:hypothetical protein [Tengunoibacter tsumagoiensis]GCE13227.1 hypothetical protein KTT_30860 [Tengunoibacter tsumagoiensis]
MEEKASSSSVSTPQAQSASAAAYQESTAPVERSEAEQRKAYGTAKTENLRDSGLWRIILPGAIALFCISLLAIPLFILIPLLSNSIAALHGGNPQEAQLIWVWITMIVLELIISSVVIWGLCRIFLTQAGNYGRSHTA